jgi:DNA-binding transcriptional MerR regulator
LTKAATELPNPEVLFLEAQPRLTFGVKAAAYGCGISVRQLDWWTRVGYVPVLQSGRHRRYSANAVKIALLIKSGLVQGLSLRRAAEAARQLYPSLWEGSPPAPSLEDPPPSPSDELEAIRGEVSRLTAELSEIGKRLGSVLGTPEPSEADMDGDEDE